MNIIRIAVDDIKRKIPSEVLKVVFQDKTSGWRNANAPISIDEEIISKVIKSRVIVDTNLLGGQTIVVSLEGLNPRFVDTFTVVYEIPAERVMFRSIMSVLSISYLPYAASFNSMGAGMGIVNPSSMNDVSGAAQRVGDSMSSIPNISNANVELIGHNTVLIREQVRITNAYQLRCVVANEENLANINPRSFLNFARLCELAVKSHIYNKMIIAMDMAYLSGGQELGAFKTYVENLSDSEEMYGTYLREVWAATAFMNSTQDYSRFIRTQMNPAL